MTLIKTLVSSLILSVTLVSCTERIDLPLDESSVRLVVDGAITNTMAIHRIYLSKTTNYYYNQEPPKVSGASVSISDGLKIFLLTEETPGVYQTASDFQGVEGRTYILNIKLNTPVGGFTEYTATSVMPRATVLDSVNLAFYPEYGDEGIWEVRCFMNDPPTTDYYRFLVSRNERMLTVF
jgi:hypothetical protein